MGEFRCSRCQQVGLQRNEVILYHRSGERTYYYCNPCNSARIKKYRKTPRGSARTLKATQKFAKKNPTKVAAWKAARHLPDKPCEVCGTTKFIHKHHDDYTKPLEVIHLCAKHHKERHRELVV